MKLIVIIANVINKQSLCLERMAHLLHLFCPWYHLGTDKSLIRISDVHRRDALRTIRDHRRDGWIRGVPRRKCVRRRVQRHAHRGGLRGARVRDARARGGLRGERVRRGAQGEPCARLERRSRGRPRTSGAPAWGSQQGAPGSSLGEASGPGGPRSPEGASGRSLEEEHRLGNRVAALEVIDI